MAAPAERDPVDVVRSYLAAFATGDADAVADHVGPGFVNEHRSAAAVGCTGRDEYRRRLPGFLSAFPDLSYEVLDVIADQGRVVVAYTMHARPAGRPIAVPGVMWFEVVGGQIARRVDLFDSGAA